MCTHDGFECGFYCSCECKDCFPTVRKKSKKKATSKKRRPHSDPTTDTIRTVGGLVIIGGVAHALFDGF